MRIIIPDHVDLTTGDFFVYRTVCVPTGQYYIGKSHVKRRKNYYGSGPEIHRLKDKYGMKNLVKEIIVNSDNEDLIIDLEEAIIAEFKNDPLCINKADRRPGSRAGELAGENHPFWGKPGPMTGKKHSDETKTTISTIISGMIWVTNGPEEIRIDYNMPIPDGFRRGRKEKDRRQSEETKAKISKANKGRKRSQEFSKRQSQDRKGRIWVNNGVESRILKPHGAIPAGWVRGRLPNKKRRKEND